MRHLTLYLHVAPRINTDYDHGNTAILLGARTSMPPKGRGEGVVKLRLQLPDELFAEPPVQVIDVEVPPPAPAVEAVVEAEAVDP